MAYEGQKLAIQWFGCIAGFFQLLGSGGEFEVHSLLFCLEILLGAPKAKTTILDSAEL